MPITPLVEILRNYFKTSDAVFKSDFIGKTLREILQIVRTNENSESSARTVVEAEPECSCVSAWLSQSAGANEGLSNSGEQMCCCEPSGDLFDWQVLDRFVDDLTLSKIIRKRQETLFVFKADSSTVAFEASFHLGAIEEVLKSLPFKNIRVKITRS